jgi:hypothetical protein
MIISLDAEKAFNKIHLFMTNGGEKEPSYTAGGNVS